MGAGARYKRLARKRPLNFPPAIGTERDRKPLGHAFRATRAEAGTIVETRAVSLIAGND